MNPKDSFICPSPGSNVYYANGCSRPKSKSPIYPVPGSLQAAAEKYGNRSALIFYGKKITYRELKDSVDRLATALADLGVKKGEQLPYIS